MIYKKAVLVLLLLTSSIALSGCLTGELLISQQMQEDQRVDEAKRINKEYKDKGLPPIMDEKPRQVIDSKDINPIAMLAVDRPEGEPVKLLALETIKQVSNGGTPPSFTISQSHFITDILTYHWNGSAGAAAGTIELKDASGKIYGPWQTTLESGVYWTVKPNFTIPAGTYTVIDSDPTTWSQNEETGGQGITVLSGIPTK